MSDKLLYQVGEIVIHRKAPERGYGIIVSINADNENNLGCDVGDVERRHLPYYVQFDGYPLKWSTAEENIMLVASDRFKYCTGDIIRLPKSYDLYRIEHLYVKNATSKERFYFVRKIVPYSSSSTEYTSTSYTGTLEESNIKEKVIIKKLSVGDAVCHRLKKDSGVGVVCEINLSHHDSDYVDYRSETVSDLYCGYRIQFGKTSYWWTHQLNIERAELQKPKFSVGDLVVHINHMSFGVGEIIQFDANMKASDYMEPESVDIEFTSAPYGVMYIDSGYDTRWWTSEKNLRLIKSASKSKAEKLQTLAKIQENNDKNYVRSILLRAILDHHDLRR